MTSHECTRYRISLSENSNGFNWMNQGQLKRYSNRLDLVWYKHKQGCRETKECLVQKAEFRPGTVKREALLVWKGSEKLSGFSKVQLGWRHRHGSSSGSGTASPRGGVTWVRLSTRFGALERGDLIGLARLNMLIER